MGYRLRAEAGKIQALHRACGFSKGIIPSVIDATAGLGRDSFLLASLGARVTLIERSAVLHGLLQDGMDRARDAGLATTIDRMILLHGNSIEMLKTLAADTVLVDPMHPPRKNTALVKKEMRDLREIVGDDQDSFQLMQAALQIAGKRVVLKWPLRADPMPDLRKPSHQIIGKTTRYDVFMK